MRTEAKKDAALILSVSTVSAILYLSLEGPIMAYGRNSANPLLLRFLPVLIIQFGMSCLGPVLVLIKNKEKLSGHGLVKKNAILSAAGSLLFSVPTVLFLWLTDDIHGFLPFQGMFLTKAILSAAFPLNALGYLIIALVWGFGEGLFYVVLADKINAFKTPKGLWNAGAFVCAVIAPAIHGMIGFDLEVMAEALTTFLLMYGSLVIREKTGNAWGCLLIFFVVWNAL